MVPLLLKLKGRPAFKVYILELAQVWLLVGHTGPAKMSSMAIASLQFLD